MGAENSILFVTCLGVGTVFIGLVSIIILTKIMSAFCKNSNKANENISKTVNSPTASIQNNNIENRQEIIAAVSAAIAETLGEEVDALKIISFKKI